MQHAASHTITVQPVFFVMESDGKLISITVSSINDRISFYSKWFAALPSITSLFALRRNRFT